MHRIVSRIALLALLMLIGAGTSVAQFENRVKLVDAVKRPRVNSGQVRPRPAAVVRSNSQKVVVRETMVRITYLAVTTEAGAKVVVEPKGPRPGPKKELFAGPNGTADFQGLAPGAYKVTASKDGFDTEVNEDVRVVAQRGQVLPMDLEAVKYKLKIATNLRAVGEVFYALRDPTAAGGSNPISEREGDYCVVKVKPNGEAEVSDLKKGYYFIDIRPGPDAPQYNTIKTGLNVPEDLEQGGDAPFEIDLETKVSDKPFSSNWLQAEWKMPSTWRLDKAMKVRNTEGIALPQNEQFRNYIDFGLSTYVKINDEGVVGFALRAIDEKNYYLLQLSGAKAPEPLRTTLFAVKNGVATILDSRTAAPFARTMAADKGFSLLVQGKGSVFTVWIDDAETGKRQAVGELSDQYKTFQKGAVGIVGSSKSSFDIRIFTVCTPMCDQ